MKISLKHLILLSFLFVLAPALLLLSYTDYSKAKQELEDNFEFMVDQTAENVIGAYDLVEVGYRILSLSLENKMLSAFEPFKAAYYKANGVVSDIDLPSLKSVLGEEFDLYIIDEFGVIIHTTFAKDQDLDFSKVAPSFNEKLQKIKNVEIVKVTEIDKIEKKVFNFELSKKNTMKRFTQTRYKVSILV